MTFRSAPSACRLHIEPMERPLELDVRAIPPRDKHPAIFPTFDSLKSGEAFTLVNDHDPVPLRYQFEATRTGQFTWSYLEEGPSVWRVAIGKT